MADPARRIADSSRFRVITPPPNYTKLLQEMNKLQRQLAEERELEKQKRAAQETNDRWPKTVWAVTTAAIIIGAVFITVYAHEVVHWVSRLG